MAILTKAQVKKNLKEIETTLIERVPELVKAKPCKGPAYAVLMCYFDLTVDEYTPLIIVAPESLRTKHDAEIKDEMGEPAWSPHQRLHDANLPEIYFEDEAFSKLCNDVYETISDNWGDKNEEEVILPFRKVMYKVAKALNKLDWSDYLDVTNDFVVAAVDYSGHWVNEDVPASIPSRQKKMLQKAGWLLDIEILKKDPRTQSYMATMFKMKLMRPKKRAEFALSILDKLHKGEPVGAYDNPMELIRDIEKTKQAGLVPSLQFIAARAGTQPYVGPYDFKDKDRPSLSLRVLLRSLRFYQIKTTREMEALLQSIIRKSLPYAEDNDDAASLIGVAAEHLHRRFKGYPKPDSESNFAVPVNIQDFLR